MHKVLFFAWNFFNDLKLPALCENEEEHDIRLMVGPLFFSANNEEGLFLVWQSGSWVFLFFILFGISMFVTT